MLAEQEGSRGKGLSWERGALQPNVSGICHEARDGRERLSLAKVGDRLCIRNMSM